MNPTIIIGPPGTGKTTAIIDRIEAYLSGGGKPDRIGYVSFTRRALHVARDRMAKQYTGFTKNAFPYFRTLHSMCYHLAGITSGQVMDKEHMKALANKLGLNFHGVGIKDEGVVETGGPDSALLFHENLARLTKCSYEQHCEKHPGEVDLQELLRFQKSYREYRRSHNLVDFTDMLSLGAYVVERPNLDLLLVDEAQDLSPLQWDVVRALSIMANETVIAGDANQAIYTWAGADVEYFVNLKGKLEMLRQGYRMAWAPHLKATTIADRIQVKHNTTFKPRNVSGCYMHYDSIPDINQVQTRYQGDWLVLARTNLLLSQAKREWKEWHPNIKARFSTIHMAKGAESDNVVLMTGMSEKCWRRYQDRPDDELRVWYVGASRTRENLYIVPSQHARYQFDMEG